MRVNQPPHSLGSQCGAVGDSRVCRGGHVVLLLGDVGDVSVQVACSRCAGGRSQSPRGFKGKFKVSCGRFEPACACGAPPEQLISVGMPAVDPA